MVDYRGLSVVKPRKKKQSLSEKIAEIKEQYDSALGEISRLKDEVENEKRRADEAVDAMEEAQGAITYPDGWGEIESLLAKLKEARWRAELGDENAKETLNQTVIELSEITT